MTESIAQPPAPSAIALRLYAFGTVGTLLGIVHLMPLVVLPFYPEELWLLPAFAIPGLGLITVSMPFVLSTRTTASRATKLGIADGAMIIVVSWCLSIVVSTVPFLVYGEIDFVGALFETTSGWTTTGLSVVDVERAPRVILMWRSVMQLAGGAGFAIIMISAVSLPLGMGISLAEGRSDQLVPNVIRSAKLVVSLYLLYAVFGAVAYMFAGMSPFDAVNHSFAAVSTGGFSTRENSIGHFASASIEWISIPLMILGNMNFLIAYALIRGKLTTVFRSAEVQAFLIIWLLALLGLVFVGAERDMALRVALFEATTALTTTGFSILNYAGWSDGAYAIFVAVMIIGGGSGSTAGGVKQIRIYILSRAAFSQVHQVFLPRRTVVQRQFFQGESRVTLSDEMVAKTGAFLAAYLLLFTIGVIVMTSHGISFLDAVFEFASSLGTVGLSIGVTGPELPKAVLLVQTLGMLMGRLEIFMLFSGLFASLRLITRIRPRRTERL